MPARRRFPVGTIIRVWRTTSGGHIKNGPWVDHQIKVYEGPERRSNIERRKGLSTRLENVDKMWNEMRTPQDGFALQDTLKRLEEKYIARGRRKNGGFRPVGTKDIGSSVSAKLHHAAHKGCDNIESAIETIMKKGHSRQSAIQQLIMSTHLVVATTPSGKVIGIKCAAENSEKGTTIVAYNPISLKLFWTSTRRTKLSRREPDRNITVEAWSPEDENFRNN